MKDDRTLLRQYALCADEDSFRQLVSRHIDLVYAVGLRQVNGDAELAQEVTQAVFTDLARKAKSLLRCSVLTGWLHEAARFAGAKAARAEQRRRSHEQKASFMQERTDDPTQRDWEQLRPVLDVAIADLSATDRCAVLLRFFQGKDFRTIGTELGLSEDAAQKRVSRSLDRLRRTLRRRGITLTTAALAAALGGGAVTVAPSALATSVAAASLAATPAGATTLAALLYTMASTQTKTIVAALIAASVMVSFTLQYRTKTTVQDENSALRGQLAEAQEELVTERNLTASHASELERLRQEEADLLRLRNEVRKLRLQPAEHANLEAEKRPPQATSANTPLLAFGTELQDLGAATPERAVTSLLSAGAAGKIERVSELLDLPNNVSEQDAPRHYAFWTRRFSNHLKAMEFTSIAGAQQNSDGTMQLKIMYRQRDTGSVHPFPFTLRLHDSVWKVVVEGDAPEQLPEE